MYVYTILFLIGEDKSGYRFDKGWKGWMVCMHVCMYVCMYVMNKWLSISYNGVQLGHGRQRHPCFEDGVWFGQESHIVRRATKREYAHLRIHVCIYVLYVCKYARDPERNRLRWTQAKADERVVVIAEHNTQKYDDQYVWNNSFKTMYCMYTWSLSLSLLNKCILKYVCEW